MIDEDDPTLWRSAIDKKSGKTYYYHRNSRSSTWKKPKCLIEMEEIQKSNTIELFDFTEAIDTINNVLENSTSLDILIQNLDSSCIDTRENAIGLLLCCFIPSTMNYLAQNEALVNSLINMVLKSISDVFDSNSARNGKCRRSALRCLWCFSTKLELAFVFQRNQAWTILYKFFDTWNDAESVIIYSYMISLLLCTSVSNIITSSMTDFIYNWLDDNYFNKIKVLSKANLILDLDYLIVHPTPNGLSMFDETVLNILLNGYTILKYKLPALILLVLIDNTLQSQQHNTLFLKSCGFDLLHFISIFSNSSSDGISTKVKTTMLDIISSCTYIKEKFFDSFINMGKMLSNMYSNQNNPALVGLYPYDNIRSAKDIPEDKMNEIIFEVELRPKDIYCGWKVSAAVIWTMLPNLRSFLVQFYEEYNIKHYTSQNPFVIELDISANVLASIIRYIHSGALIACYDDREQLELILAASKLGVKTLEVQASFMYANNMDKSTASIALDFSVENKLDTLEKLCTTYLTSSSKPLVSYRINNQGSVSEIVNLRDAIASSIHQVSKVLNEVPSFPLSMVDKFDRQILYESHTDVDDDDDLMLVSPIEFDPTIGISKLDKNSIIFDKSVEASKNKSCRRNDDSKGEINSIISDNHRSKCNTRLVEFDKNMSMMPQSMPSEKELKLAMITRPRLPNYKLKKPVVVTNKNYDQKNDLLGPGVMCDMINDENDEAYTFDRNPARCNSPTNVSSGRRSDINRSEVRDSLALLKSKSKRRSVVDVENERSEQFISNDHIFGNNSNIVESNNFDLNGRNVKSNSQTKNNNSSKTTFCSRKNGCTCPACDEGVNSSNTKTYSPDDHTDESQYNEQESALSSNVTLITCPECGRKFNEQSFSKHVTICAKVFQQKRKVFDSSISRVVDSDHYTKSTTNSISRNNTSSKWKIQSNAFRQAMQAARQPNDTSSVTVSTTDPSYVQCPNCLRRFNEVAAERHIPLCKNKPNSTLKRGTGVGIGSGNGRKSIRKNAWD